jgi:hypothetical protein
MILEQQEAEHIELRPNLLKACAEERQAFCSGVAPGSARVFRWVRCVGCSLRGLTTRKLLYLLAACYKCCAIAMAVATLSNPWHGDLLHMQLACLRYVLCSLHMCLTRACEMLCNCCFVCFRCLAEKLADPDFGPKCRYEVIAKLQRRWAVSWRIAKTVAGQLRCTTGFACA